MTRIRATAAALVAALAVTACAGPVSVPEPEVDPETRRICGQILSALPRTVLDAPRRDTTGSLSAAWGQPPITLACGVPQPAAMATDTRCFEVDGVGWFSQEGDTGYLFTTIGRGVTVQVGVPQDYAPEANALVDLAAAIEAHDPEHTPCL